MSFIDYWITNKENTLFFLVKIKQMCWYFTHVFLISKSILLCKKWSKIISFLWVERFELWGKHFRFFRFLLWFLCFRLWIFNTFTTYAKTHFHNQKCTGVPDFNSINFEMNLKLVFRFLKFFSRKFAIVYIVLLIFLESKVRLNSCSCT